MGIGNGYIPGWTDGQVEWVVTVVVKWSGDGKRLAVVFGLSKYVFVDDKFYLNLRRTAEF